MAYVKGPVTIIDTSPSLIPGNLTFFQDGSAGESDSTMFGVIHKHCLTVGACGSTPDTHYRVSYGKIEDKNTSSYLTQATWCKLEDSLVILVLTSYKGLQILDKTGSKLLHSNGFETAPGAFNSCFAKGVASVGNYLCVGTSEGTILVFSIAECGNKVNMIKPLEGHTAPISDIVACTTGGRQIVSSDELGNILLWQDVATSTKPSITISDSSGVPCLCLSVWNTFIIGGYGNGQLRLYDSESGIRVVEVSAHARPVLAIDVASSAGIMLSTSEDCTVCVWSLPILKNPKLNLLHLEVVKNSVLCGARFTDSRGSRFAVTAYDSHEIKTYIRNSTPV